MRTRGDGDDAPRWLRRVGGESRGLIERTFRERIVLVGVTFPPDPTTTPTPRSTSWSCSSTPPAPTWSAASMQRRDRARPRDLRRQGQGARDPRALRSGRLRHRGLRRRAHARAAVQPREDLGRTAIDRTAVILDIFAQNASQPGGQGAGRVGAAALPAAPPAGHGLTLSQQARWRHRHAWPGRDPARGRPAPHRAPHPQARGRPS